MLGVGARGRAARGEAVADGLAAGAVAAALSGVPSTLHGLLVTGRPLDAALAAGALALPRERRRGRLLLAAVPVHLAISLAWGVVLALTLPRRHAVWEGMAAGLAIAGLDLGLLGRRSGRVRALPTLPQVADHLAFGALVGAVLSRRRARGRPAGGWRRCAR